MKRAVHVAVSGSCFTVGDEGAGFQRASRERSEQLTGASNLTLRIARRRSAGADGETAPASKVGCARYAVSPDATKTAASSAIRASGASNLTLQQPPV